MSDPADVLADAKAATVEAEVVLLELGKVCRRLDVSDDTVRRLIHQGHLRGVKIPGGHWRVPRHELDAFIERYTFRKGTKVPQTANQP